ncbi:MAG: WbqC family protein [Rhodospirillaceae bacterium]|nr:WbqC family protein [Rhodospirillaceae bacterium]
MIVAIHQPNYVPWLGYFFKIERADVFVLLDDAQYSKNSYINRVGVDAGGVARWLTVPVSYSFGDPINRVRAADPAWTRSHCDTLRALYSRAPAFKSVWPWVSKHYAKLPGESLASSNRMLLESIAAELGLASRYRLASELGFADIKGDARLVELVRACGGLAYLSGRGGANYQDPERFAEAGIRLVYSDFAHPIYDQGHGNFLPGLSVFDALFRLGWEGTAKLIRRTARTS